MILFVGSYRGMVPHTREPRLYVSVSEPALKRMFERRLGAEVPERGKRPRSESRL